MFFLWFSLCFFVFFGFEVLLVIASMNLEKHTKKRKTKKTKKRGFEETFWVTLKRCFFFFFVFLVFFFGFGIKKTKTLGVVWFFQVQLHNAQPTQELVSALGFTPPM